MDNKPENNFEVNITNSPLPKKEQIFWERFLIIFGLSMGLLSLLVPIILILFWS